VENVNKTSMGSVTVGIKNSDGDVVYTNTQETVKRSIVLTVYTQGAGKMRVNPLHYAKVETDYPRGRRGTQSLSSSSSSWNDGYFGSPLPNTYISGEANARVAAYNAALSRFYDQLRDSALQMAVTLGELPETVQMVNGVVGAIRGGKRYMRKALRDFVRDPSREMSEYWLAYRYGWRPLFQDLYNAMTFESSVEPKSRVRGRATTTITDQATSGSGVTAWTFDQKGTFRHEIGAFLSMQHKWVHDMSRYSALNPATIAWELMPLSFVVDWFYDIGQVLASLEGALGYGYTLDMGWSTATSKKTSQGRQEYSYDTTARRYYGSVQSKRIAKEMSRESLGGFPLPRLPVVQVDLRSQQMIDAAALFRTFIQKGRRA